MRGPQVSEGWSEGRGRGLATPSLRASVWAPPIRPGPGLPAWSSGVSPQPALGFPLEAAPGLRLSLRSPPGPPEPACPSLGVSPPRLGATPRRVGGGPGDLTGPSGALADRPCSNSPRVTVASYFIKHLSC